MNAVIVTRSRKCRYALLPEAMLDRSEGDDSEYLAGWKGTNMPRTLPCNLNKFTTVSTITYPSLVQISAHRLSKSGWSKTVLVSYDQLVQYTCRVATSLITRTPSSN